MELIRHLKAAKYLQPSYPLLGYMSWRGNTATVFLVSTYIYLYLIILKQGLFLPYIFLHHSKPVKKPREPY
jgi:hypothetical protein